MRPGHGEQKGKAETMSAKQRLLWALALLAVILASLLLHGPPG